MRKLKPLVAAAGCLAATLIPADVSAQVSVLGNAGAAANYVGWNAAQAFPLPVQHLGNQPIHFSTNAFRRMTISPGGNAFNNGFIGMGNALPGAFLPQARLHLFNTSAVSNVNGVLMNSSFSGTTATDGFFIGRVEDPVLGTGQTFFTNFEPDQPQVFYTHAPGGAAERFRIQAHGTGATPGYIGVNNATPLFHMDMITPAFGGGELFYSARPSDVPGSTMGLLNGANGNGVFLPIFFGNVDNTQAGPGMQTVGNVDPSQDNAANFASVVTRFVSSQGWVFNTTGVGALSRRHLFSWMNGNNTNMLMNVAGQLRIMNNLNPATHVPGNRLEVTAATSDPYGGVIAVNGASGLRLTNLTSTKTPLANPGPGVLSVDANGDVIYVQGAVAPGCCIGNLCGAALNPLAGSWQVPMNGFNYTFADPVGPLNDGQNFVGIGTACVPRAKLDVFRGVTNNALFTVIGTWVENRDIAQSAPYSGLAYGTYSISDNQNKGNYGLVGEAVRGGANIGVMGNTNDVYTGGPNAYQNYGVQGVAQEAQSNTGVYGAAFTTNTLSVSNTGGLFSASVSNGTNSVIQNDGISVSAVNNGGTTVNDNRGIYNYTVNSGTSTFNHAERITALNLGTTTDNLGVYSVADNNTGTTTNNVGVVGISLNSGTSGNSIGLYGEGQFGDAAYFAGTTTTGPVIVFSDQKLKENVQGIQNATELLNRLNPVTYNYKSAETSGLHLGNQLQYGFIAQEVEQVVPALVSNTHKPEFKDKEGKVISAGGDYKGVNYDGIIPILTKSLQEQQAMIAGQQKQIEELTRLVKTLMPQEVPASTGAHQDIELSDKNTIVLNQNVPNPFAESTVIDYVLPEQYGRAQMQFFNASGQLIKTVDINEKGSGRINVYANDLSSGTYSYSLVIDGKVMDTKRMIKTK